MVQNDPINFLSTFKKKIDKLDVSTVKNILYEILEENENLKVYLIQ